MDENHDILVYNQTFIQENFFESESLKGIFTLSKENKEAETKISDAQKEIEKLEKEVVKESEQLETEKVSINQKLDGQKNTVWKIKTDYSGGDRVNSVWKDIKAQKITIQSHINYSKTNDKPKSIDDLKNEIQAISWENVSTLTSLLIFRHQI